VSEPPSGFGAAGTPHHLARNSSPGLPLSELGYSAFTADAITLTLPCERRFFQLARLVVAGLATRLDLPYEQMDDLQLAVETVLGKHCAQRELVTIELEIEPETIRIGVGPLASSRPLNGGKETELGTQRLLDTLVAHVEVIRGDGGDGVRLEAPIRRQRVAG
jgi:hypothetical protein